jgi:hypothetical protein
MLWRELSGGLLMEASSGPAQFLGGRVSGGQSDGGQAGICVSDPGDALGVDVRCSGGSSVRGN